MNNKHEGEDLKLRLKGMGLKLATVADMLDMTYQNLSHHFRKEKLDENFKRLIKEKIKGVLSSENISVANPDQVSLESQIRTESKVDVTLSYVAEIYAHLKGGSVSSTLREAEQQVKQQIKERLDGL